MEGAKNKSRMVKRESWGKDSIRNQGFDRGHSAAKRIQPETKYVIRL
jgi:hypothetical protein